MENEGLKEEIINNLIKNKKNINKYQEKEILVNFEAFVENLLTRSHENEKIILIRRSTENIQSNWGNI